MRRIPKYPMAFWPLMILLLLPMLFSCAEPTSESSSGDGDDDGESETATSVAGSSRSHNFGQNCFSCHTSGSGSEASEYQWTVAGSVAYNGSALTGVSGAVIKFYKADNTLVATLPVDAIGNFYTTTSITGMGSLYPEISYNGTTHRMSSPASASCANCHALGGTQGLIYAD